MKLENDKLVIESRYEIDHLQNALSDYLKTGKLNEVDKKEYEVIIDRLDSLYMCW